MKLKLALQQGYTLIELLIALALTLFLSTLAIHTLIQAKKIYTTAYYFSQWQNKIHLAMTLLSRDIRMAGFIGCVPLTRVLRIGAWFTPQTRLVVWHNGQSSAPFPLLSMHHVKPDSDKILIQAMDAKSYTVMSAQNHRVTLFDWPPFQKGDALIISDCRQAESFSWGQASLQHRYTQESEVAYFNKIVYYVGETERYDLQGRSIYALYRRDLNKSFYRPTELIAGILNLSVHLGVNDPITGVFSWISAEQMTANQRLQSVEITLRYQETSSRQNSRQWIVALREPDNL